MASASHRIAVQPPAIGVLCQAPSGFLEGADLSAGPLCVLNFNQLRQDQENFSQEVANVAIQRSRAQQELSRALEQQQQDLTRQLVAQQRQLQQSTQRARQSVPRRGQ